MSPVSTPIMIIKASCLRIFRDRQDWHTRLLCSKDNICSLSNHFENCRWIFRIKCLQSSAELLFFFMFSSKKREFSELLEIRFKSQRIAGSQPILQNFLIESNFVYHPCVIESTIEFHSSKWKCPDLNLEYFHLFTFLTAECGLINVSFTGRGIYSLVWTNFEMKYVFLDNSVRMIRNLKRRDSLKFHSQKREKGHKCR